MNKTVNAFRWAVAIGIVQDWVLALPAVFAPNAVLRTVGADTVADPQWPAFAGWLLLLLSLLYVPAVVDPVRYRLTAILTVAARAAGAVFFLLLYPGQFPWWFGLVDLTFFAVQGALLVASQARPGVELA